MDLDGARDVHDRGQNRVAPAASHPPAPHSGRIQLPAGGRHVRARARRESRAGLAGFFRITAHPGAARLHFEISAGTSVLSRRWTKARGASVLGRRVKLRPHGVSVLLGRRCVAAAAVCVVIVVVVGAMVIADILGQPHSLRASKFKPSVWKETPDGSIIGLKPLTPQQVQNLETQWGKSYHREKGKQKWGARDTIYVDADGNYWIGSPGSDYVNEFP